MQKNVPLKLVMIDDEPDAIAIMQSYIHDYCDDLDIVGYANDVKSGIHLIRQTQPHIILLDINLGDKTGFDILDKFPNPSFRVIFITAYDQFALKAFHYNAIDYLLKPIDPNAFVHSIDKTMKAIYKDLLFEQQFQIGNLLQNYKTKTFDKITLSTSEGLIIIELKDILYLQSDVNYTKFYLTNGETAIVSKPLKDYENYLPKDVFYRIHQSYIVHLFHVKKILKEDGGIVLLRNGRQLPISRRKKDAFIKKMTA